MAGKAVPYDLCCYVEKTEKSALKECKMVFKQVGPTVITGSTD